MKHQLAQLTHLTYLPLWLILATFVGLSYLSFAYCKGYTGFPLDDAWIHQTYARNLGLRGEFSFTPGLISTGSTAPLWVLLLSVAYALGLPFKLWTYGLGILCLGLSGFSMARLGQQIFANQPWLGPLIGLSLIFEWHLVWAAVSGMETILFICLSILLIEYAVRRTRSLWERGDVSLPLPPKSLCLLGCLGGLLTLTRPEGLGLMGLIAIFIALSPAQIRSMTARHQPLSMLTSWLLMGLGFSLIVTPYLILNLSTTGLLFPNTLYAKQSEYALLLENTGPLLRWGQMIGVTLIGGHILLSPGVIAGIFWVIKSQASLWKPRKENDLAHLTPALWKVSGPLALVSLWWFSILTLYALRLPVTYQHGRYQMPTIPWLILFGLWGCTHFMRWHHPQLWPRVLSRVAGLSFCLGMSFFLLLGGYSYAKDVRFIESEMIATAHWLVVNTPPDSIIAAHDIGAIGYITERPLVDLAGLITPAVIPFIRDEAKLLAFSQAQQASYLVTFPSWYPTLTQTLEEVYSTDRPWTVKEGHDNMAVYRLENGLQPLQK